MDDEKNENGNDAVQERHGYVLHRRASKVGYGKSNDEFVRLQFADGPLSHQADARDQNDEYNKSAQYHGEHTRSMRVTLKNITVRLRIFLRRYRFR